MILASTTELHIMHDLPRLMTINDVAQLLRRHRSSVYRLMYEDASFPVPVRIGRSPRFRAADLEAWIQRLPDAR